MTGNKALEESVGKTILWAQLVYDVLLTIALDDGFMLKLSDGQQDCCENRYMRTDDDLEYYAGSTLLGIEIRDAPDAPGADVHEVQFLAVKTSKGEFVMSSHNEHNGYYGGFEVSAARCEQ